MNQKSILLAILAPALFLTACTPKTPQLGKASVDKVIAAMTLEEKALLLVGTGMAGFSGETTVVGETKQLVPGAAGTTYAIPRLGIPAAVLADGPAGLRITPVREGDEQTYYCTAFPVATTLASTWNTELVENVGKAMGNEVLEYGADVLLAPALNIHRNPLCGRNFEYYSEDPVVSGKMAAAMTKGIQSNGVGVSLKHFAANNQETNRMGNDSRVTPRALREIYLKGFEIAVKESAPWTIMSSYNRINGTYAPENYDLQTTILRDEWGYKGTVMTDWFGGKDAPAMVRAGNDLLMPGTPKQYESIVEAVKNGTLSEAELNRNVRNILNMILATPRFKGHAFSNTPDLKAHAAVTRQSAAEGMVLLENSNNALPLSASIKNVAVYGVSSYDFISGGTGSGDVNEAYTVSLVEGLKNAGYQLDPQLQKQYEEYIASENEKNKPDPGNPFAAFMPRARPEELVPAPAALALQVKEADVALITIGRTSGEFADRAIEGDFNLTANEKEMIETVSKAFQAAGKKAIVILNIGGVIETASWKNFPDAILIAWQAGQEGGNTVADLLSGKVNPSGKLPVTFPVQYMDAASSANFPWDPAVVKSAGGNLMGKPDDGEEPVRNVDYTIYEEDIFVGYRYFDTFGKDVSYPFGYGLSYTSFEYANPVIEETHGEFVVNVDISNTGGIPGKEIVQLYVAAPRNASLPKPSKELKAFAKTKELKAGETQTLSMKVAKADLASFDNDESAWVADSGRYTILLATSSRETKQTIELTLSNPIITKTNKVLQLQAPVSVLKP
ncbi:glycoside hydrolase family 3 protein [Proteiniphilum sp. X52]|uniref:beta-glucosidase n=1 Tax=Proteiniphilum sp. X52 TaxID=2382159 RepID=UPI000F0A8398|nr:glycoside hydrolase family 3 C-terminal domain-containing protein [Proteiniphilum sp. X52]RNC66428.1 beta-glucosidase [Proteiniphilum sp. X52]